MNEFQVEVRVFPRTGILDPQGKAVASALSSLGFDGIDNVSVGRVVAMSVKAESPVAAEEVAKSMCRQLLANPVTEDFHVRAIGVAK